MTCSSAPQVIAIPMKIRSMPARAFFEIRDLSRHDAELLPGLPGLGTEGHRVPQQDCTFEPATAPISSSVLSRLARAWT